MYDPEIDIMRAKEQIREREKHLEAVLGCIMTEGSCYEDTDWNRKYIHMRWKIEDDVNTENCGIPDLHRMNMALRMADREKKNQ